MKIRLGFVSNSSSSSFIIVSDKLNKDNEKIKELKENNMVPKSIKSIKSYTKE